MRDRELVLCCRASELLDSGLTLLKATNGVVLCPEVIPPRLIARMEKWSYARQVLCVHDALNKDHQSLSTFISQVGPVMWRQSPRDFTTQVNASKRFIRPPSWGSRRPALWELVMADVDEPSSAIPASQAELPTSEDTAPSNAERFYARHYLLSKPSRTVGRRRPCGHQSRRRLYAVGPSWAPC